MTDATAASRVAEHQPIGDRDWHRVYEPLLTEHDYVVDEIDGKLPPELTGTLYRNGPGKWESGGSPLGHIFDGDGMLSSFAFDGQRIRYRNRYVRTSHFRAEQHGRGGVPRGFGTQRPGGFLANALRLPANMANTSVVMHAGELLALWEGGKPHALDPDTLATRGMHDFGGKLRWLGAFSAHPKVDPRTGELFNFGVEALPRLALGCYRVDSAGRLQHLARVPLPRFVFNHDFALTERHLVFVIHPLQVSRPGALRIALGLSAMDRELRFDLAKGTRIVLVPRDGGAPKVTEYEGIFYTHVNNAYEDGTDTVVDLVRYDVGPDVEGFREEFVSAARGFRTGDYPFAGGRLSRLRVTGSGRATLEGLSDSLGDFAQYDTRLTGRAHRYGYLAIRTTGGAPSAIAKVDHRGGREWRHELPVDHPVSEPIFVPRAPDAGEDDGWLLAVAYDPAEHRSRLLIVDARDPAGDPVAVAHLRHHIPQGFHGTFTQRVAR